MLGWSSAGYSGWLLCNLVAISIWSREEGVTSARSLRRHLGPLPPVPFQLGTDGANRTRRACGLGSVPGSRHGLSVQPGLLLSRVHGRGSNPSPPAPLDCQVQGEREEGGSGPTGGGGAVMLLPRAQALGSV